MVAAPPPCSQYTPGVVQLGARGELLLPETTPGGTRTLNPRFRRPMLYPIELRARGPCEPVRTAAKSAKTRGILRHPTPFRQASRRAWQGAGKQARSGTTCTVCRTARGVLFGDRDLGPIVVGTSRHILWDRPVPGIPEPAELFGTERAIAGSRFVDPQIALPRGGEVLESANLEKHDYITRFGAAQSGLHVLRRPAKPPGGAKSMEMKERARSKSGKGVILAGVTAYLAIAGTQPAPRGSRATTQNRPTSTSAPVQGTQSFLEEMDRKCRESRAAVTVAIAKTKERHAEELKLTPRIARDALIRARIRLQWVQNAIARLKRDKRVIAVYGTSGIWYMNVTRENAQKELTLAEELVRKLEAEASGKGLAQELNRRRARHRDELRSLDRVLGLVARQEVLLTQAIQALSRVTKPEDRSREMANWRKSIEEACEQTSQALKAAQHGQDDPAHLPAPASGPSPASRPTPAGRAPTSVGPRSPR